MAINHDWVHNQACRLSHDIHVVSHSFISFNNLFKEVLAIRRIFSLVDMITNIKFSNYPNVFFFKLV